MAQFGFMQAEPSDMRARGTTGAYKRRKASAARCLASATEALAGFESGSHVFGLTKGQFSMIDLADAALAITGPADVAIWTWCIAEYEVEAITKFLTDKRVESLRMVMDWTGAQRDMPVVEELQERFGLDCIRVTKTHAKIVTIATECGWRVTIRGSMNLNFNPRFEQFDVSDDAGIYAVVEDMMAELWERGKPLPVRKLHHGGATALLAASDANAYQAPAWAAGLKSL
jgi:hypothetical protein